jgi:hypothetical protein
MDYLDFEIEIHSGRRRKYPVSVEHSPAGEARETMNFPFAPLVLENQLLSLENALLQSGSERARRRIAAPEQRTAQDFGVALLDALLTGDIRSRFDVSRREALAQGKGIRVKLRIEAPELAALPWEFMFEPRTGDFLSLSREIAVVRYPVVAQPSKPLSITPPLRVLGMVSSPNDLEPLDTAREMSRIESALQEMKAAGHLEWHWLKGQTWRDLRAALRHGPWHVFHFIGHGGFDTRAEEGFLALADERGKARYVSATEVGRLLHDHNDLRLVILNACLGAQGGTRDVFSSTAATLTRRGIPAVVAMQYEITDLAAIEFARTFYEQIAEGLPVDTAVAEARIAISMAIPNSLEWGTPVLYMRSPDGHLFNMEVASSKVDPPPPIRPSIQVAPPVVQPEIPPKMPDIPPDPSPELDQEAEDYIERVLDRLRAKQFSLQRDISYRGYAFRYVARGSGFDRGIMMIGDTAAIFVIARFATVDLDTLSRYAMACAEYAESQRVGTSLSTLYCVPVAVADHIGPEAAAAIVRSKPTMFRMPPSSHLVLPGAYDLRANSLYYPIDVSFWATMVWSRIREMVQMVLSMSNEPAGPSRSGDETRPRNAVSGVPSSIGAKPVGLPSDSSGDVQSRSEPAAGRQVTSPPPAIADEPGLGAPDMSSNAPTPWGSPKPTELPTSPGPPLGHGILPEASRPETAKPTSLPQDETSQRGSTKPPWPPE